MSGQVRHMHAHQSHQPADPPRGLQPTPPRKALIDLKRTVVPLVVELPLHNIMGEHLLNLRDALHQALCACGVSVGVGGGGGARGGGGGRDDEPGGFGAIPGAVPAPAVSPGEGVGVFCF